MIIAIGSHTAALWVALPIAVLIASYVPGTFPFAIGQAFFTVTIFILFNILVPVGWKVGVVRLEDVAIGAAVSAVVGAFFWPRGASRIVADDLADAFHRGGIYLVQATTWALGVRPGFPDAGTATVLAGSRLDDAMRALMAEQGSKKVPKDQVWRLVGGTRRLRLTALSLTATARPGTPPPASQSLVEESVRLAGVCDDLAGRLSRTSSTVAQELATLPAPVGAPPHDHNSYALWVREHLVHAQRDLATMVEPATMVAGRRAQPVAGAERHAHTSRADCLALASGYLAVGARARRTAWSGVSSSPSFHAVAKASSPNACCAAATVESTVAQR